MKSGLMVKPAGIYWLNKDISFNYRPDSIFKIFFYNNYLSLYLMTITGRTIRRSGLIY